MSFLVLTPASKYYSVTVNERRWASKYIQIMRDTGHDRMSSWMLRREPGEEVPGLSEHTGACGWVPDDTDRLAS